ncbi:hypothetical protein NQD34_015760 [Periophthalmus magnuspinnatus]|nr:hypothetical protein NQD34_015760 [Periophthalmus magnuspinnatus]
MAPALTKFVKDGHNIHLSSPPASNNLSLQPSEGLQKMLFSILHSLDSYLQPNPVHLPSNARVTTGQAGSLTLPGLDCLALSYNKSVIESQQASSMLPNASDMFVLPEHNEYCLHHSPKSHQCRPGAFDVPSPHNISCVSPLVANADSVLAPCILFKQENCKLDQLVPKLELQNQIKDRASRQTDLQSRAQKLQRRLQTLLGQHASLHCNQQLEELWTQWGNMDRSAGAELSQVGSGQQFMETLPDFIEIKEFGQCSHAVLKVLQEALDSEATASSSSDEELLEIKTHSQYRETSVASPCFEKKWLNERAELGSRWTWLQLRVAELDGRIQQLTELHKNICSAKGSVVLADSQPMTDWQMKNALLRKMAGLSGTMFDTDNEPCSPTRLLHNIERQSAQLSQIVNSLMPPLTLSPLSKPSQPFGDNRAFNSDVFDSGSSKRKKLGAKRRQLFKDDMSCICARTRPLVTYHKPRLFRLNSMCNNKSSKCSSSLSGLTSCSSYLCSSSL